MTVRRLQADGDITTSGQQFITEREEIAQTISTRLKLFLGEYFRDITDGTPWFEQILGKGQNLYTRDAAIRTRISQTEGVQQISRYDSDFDLASRKYTISCSVLTVFGEVDVTVGDVING